mmetsp:Transcript_59104/g.105464  ORF Transcript_59104/g.105464 Transcript_59104/m.105464 type:complete len:377 (+) Transcript_59104:167-1297(+)
MVACHLGLSLPPGWQAHKQNANPPRSAYGSLPLPPVRQLVSRVCALYLVERPTTAHGHLLNGADRTGTGPHRVRSRKVGLGFRDRVEKLVEGAHGGHVIHPNVLRGDGVCSTQGANLPPLWGGCAGIPGLDSRQFTRRPWGVIQPHADAAQLCHSGDCCLVGRTHLRQIWIQDWQQAVSCKQFETVGQVPLALLQHPQPVDVECRAHLLPPMDQVSEQLLGAALRQPLLEGLQALRDIYARVRHVGDWQQGLPPQGAVLQKTEHLLLSSEFLLPPQGVLHLVKLQLCQLRIQFRGLRVSEALRGVKDAEPPQSEEEGLGHSPHPLLHLKHGLVLLQLPYGLSVDILDPVPVPCQQPLLLPRRAQGLGPVTGLSSLA